MRSTRRRFPLLRCAVLATTVLPGALRAQAPSGETVYWTNPRDGFELTGRLTMPPGGGPHAGVVLLTVAGTDPAVERLVAEGYAVLAPSLRGFVQVDPLLRATYEDLAGDVGAAVAYMRSLAAVDTRSVAVVAQGDNAPQAMIFASDATPAVPLVLLAPPAFQGVEGFRLEQRWIAEAQGADASDLEALDAYVLEIAEIVLAESDPFRRQVELERLRARSSVELPRNAAFPADEGQMRFLASRIWRDRLAFEPEEALSRIGSPALVLIGADEANTPMDRYLSAVRTGLGGAASTDTTVCRVPGRTRHTFSAVAVDALVAWLGDRVGPGAPGGDMSPLESCLEDGRTGFRLNHGTR